MSNQHVGPVYDHIINEVINAVRVDFEENAVEEGVLEELKKGWQHKLSQLSIAKFPWDPEPSPAPAAPTTAPAAVQPAQPPPPTASYTQATLSPQTAPQHISLPPGLHPNGNGIKTEPGLLKNEPAIKQEPGLAGNHQGAPGHLFAGPNAAAQRAAQALESQYGPRAAASISAIQSGLAHQQQQGAPRPGQPPQQMSHQQYRQNLASNMQQRMQAQQAPHPGPNGLPAAQVDGPSDAFEGVLMQRGPDGRPVEMGRVEIDSLIHARIAARAKQMEGGGLMLPLKEASRTRGIANKTRASAGPAQLDGPDDDIKDDDVDDDAINSDLDDPDDDKDDDDDDDESGQMMLCMYDKVQRVKNKWKCTLKDGVLTVNNREYVFHKATGEYEW